MPLKTEKITYLGREYTIVSACVWCPTSEHGSYYRCIDDRGRSFWFCLPPSIIAHRRFGSGLCPSCEAILQREIKHQTTGSGAPACRWCLESLSVDACLSDEGGFCGDQCREFFLDVHQVHEGLDEYGKEELW